tara:strand:- start:770 stop:877 length:108 start_codon:yes stop_codon:yes gene_type:complete
MLDLNLIKFFNKLVCKVVDLLIEIFLERDSNETFL